MCIRRFDRMTSGQKVATITDSARTAGSSRTKPDIPDWYYSHIYNKQMHVWTMPISISQSKLGGRSWPSSACTIITLSLTRILNTNQITLPAVAANRLTQSTCLPDELLLALSNAIVDGNSIHFDQMKKRKYNHLSIRSFVSFYHGTFTIPQALIGLDGDIHEIDFMSYGGQPGLWLSVVLEYAIYNKILRHHPRLFFVMIMIERAILIVYDRPTNSLWVFDSHTHITMHAGAMIASSNFKNVHTFAHNLVNILFPEIRAKGKEEFEFSCIQYVGNEKASLNKLTERVLPRPGKGGYMSIYKKVVSLRKTAISESSEDSGYETAPSAAME